MLFFTTLLVFLAAFLLLYGLLTCIYGSRISIRNRIEEITTVNSEDKDDINKDDFLQRVAKPVYDALGRLFLKMMPASKLDLLDKKLERAGISRKGTIEKWLFTKNMIMLIISAISGLIIYTVGQNVLNALIISLLLLVLVNTVFSFYLSSKIDKRKKSILKELPFTLDLITVSVEAGLSFDGAMARVVNNISGALCDEFAKSLKEIRMGIQRKIALRNLSDRCDVRELSILVTSLIQADNLGVSLGRVLRIEAANLREHRKQLAREKAMKAPVKMLIPLIFFIFPSIFTVILGPAVIKITQMFF